MKRGAVKKVLAGVAGFLLIGFTGWLGWAATFTETFTTAGNYTISDSLLVEVTGGVAKLKVRKPYVLHDTKAEFDSGTYADTEYLNTTSLPSASSSVKLSDSGLVAYYPLNGSDSDLDTNDTAGLEDTKGTYEGTANNANSTGMAHVTGRFGNGVNFDGTDDYISVGNAGQTGVVTISAWIKANDLSVARAIVSDRSSGASNHGLFVDGGTLRFYQGSDGGAPNTAYFAANTTLTTGVWYHVAATRSGSSGNWTITFYLNGVADGGGTTAYDPRSSNGPTSVGSRLPGSTTDAFNGLIDDVAIYNRVLTAAELAAQYSAGVAVHMEPTASVAQHAPKLSASMPGLVAYWPFDNSSGTTAPDHVGKLKGTLNGMETPTDWVAGINGKALDFDGTNEWITTASGIDLSKYTSGWTISGWVRPDTTPASGTEEYAILFSGVSTTSTQWQVFTSYTDANKFHVRRERNPTGVVSLTTTNTYAPGSWYHYAALWDGSNLKIYINGTQDGSVSATAVTGDAGGTQIGGINGGATYGIDGLIDEVAVFNRALSAGEIAWLAGKKGETATYTSPTMDGEIAGATWDKLQAQFSGVKQNSVNIAGLTAVANAWGSTAAAGDIDGDGDVDLVKGAGVGWHANNGDGTVWAAASSITASSSAQQGIAAADIDGDRDIDVVVSIASDGDINWYANNGSGGGWTLTAVKSAFGGPIALGDIDADGDIDVVAANNTANTIAWFANNGTGGGWTQTNIDTSFDVPLQIRLADMDGDGTLDVASSNNDGSTNAIVYWKNTAGNGSAWSAKQTVIGTRLNGAYFDVGDLNGDGFVDVLGNNGNANSPANNLNREVSWMANNGTGGGWTETSIRTWSVNGGSGEAGIADLNGDGFLDIVYGSDSNTTLYWRLNNGSGSFGSESSAPLAGAAANNKGLGPFVFADYNGDGILDFALAGNDSGGQLGVYFNTPFVYSSQTTDTSTWNAANAFAHDIDGDGDADIVFSDQATSIRYFVNNGSGVFTAASVQIYAFSGVTVTFDIGDLDSDGDSDILAHERSADGTTNNLFWLENDGSWTRHEIGTWSYSIGSAVFVIADVDSDGDMDFTYSTDGCCGDNYRAWYQNDGSQNFTAQDESTSGSERVHKTWARDMDGDGDRDFIRTGSNGGPNGLRWNNGSNVFSTSTALTNAAGIFAVADMDRDGDFDVIGSSSNYVIAWWRNDGSQNFSSDLKISSLSHGGANTAQDGHSRHQVVDIDGDGDLDFARAATKNAGYILIDYNDGNQNFTTLPLKYGDGAWRSLLVDDFDRDGDMDLVLTGNSNYVALITQSLHSKLQLQARSGTTSPPTGTFVGPDNTAATYFGALSGAGVVSNLDAKRYAQYKATFYRNDTTLDPMLKSVRTEYSALPYSTLDPYVQPNASASFMYLSSFDATDTLPANTLIKYILSPNNGANWMYWNGSAWVASNASYAQANDEATISTNIGTFDNYAYSPLGYLADNTPGTLLYRAFLHSDGNNPPELSQMDIGYETASLAIVKPNGASDIWKVGSVKGLTWTPTGVPPDDLTLEYTTDGTFASPTSIQTGVKSNNHNDELISGAVGVWHFGTATSGAIGDGLNPGSGLNDSKNANHGVGENNNGTGLAYATGKFGGGVTFDGTDDSITIGSGADQTSQMTVSAWVNVTSLTPTGTHYIVSNGNCNGCVNYNLSIGGTSGGSNKAKFQTGTGYGNSVTGTTLISTGSWYHLAGTLSGSSGNWTLKIYVNGVLENTSTGTANAHGSGLGTAIGAGWVNGESLWNGVIDEVAVFNRALSDKEIAVLASSNAGYAWTVPDDPTTQGKVRARSVSVPGLRDASDNNFTITDLNIVAPNGADYFKVGSAHNIAWLRADASVPNDLVLEYTTAATDPASTGSDPLTTWVQVVGATGLDSLSGTPYNWASVPDAVSATARVRVRSASATELVDVSNANFFIADLLMTGPNGSNLLYEGEKYDVTWAHGGTNLTDLVLEVDTGGGYGAFSPAAGSLSVRRADAASRTAGLNPASIANAVGVWRLNEGAGTTARDGAGTNTGTTTGPTWADGQFNKALSFDGNDYISVPDSAALSFTGDFTMACWFKANVIDKQLISKGDGAAASTKGYHLEFAGSGANSKISGITAGDVGGGIRVAGTTTINTGVWYHAAFVLSGTTGKIYLNGVLENSGTVLLPTNGVGALTIGARADLGGFFNGSIDDVAIYNRALTDSEIRKLAGGSYQWTVPDVPSVTTKVRVRSNGQAALTDESDANFEIRARSVVTNTPNGGEKWQIEKTYNIEWTPAGLMSNNLQLTYDNNGGSGGYGTLIATGVDAGGQPFSGCMGAWGFGEGTGQTLADKSGSANTAQLGSTAGADADDPIFVLGKFGHAMEFDGADDRVRLPAGASIKNQTRVSVAAWFKMSATPSSLGQNFVIYAEPNPTANGVRLQLQVTSDTNRLQLWFQDSDDGSGGGGTFAGTTSLSANTWYHVVGVVDTVADVQYLYLNGVQDGSASFVSGPFASTTGSPINIGAWAFSSLCAKGLIDEVQIYNRVLTSSEITALASGKAIFPWSVPEGIASAAGRVKVTDLNRDADPSRDASNNDFAVTEIEITSPNTGAEAWVVGNSYDITWDRDAVMTNVKIEYSTTGSGGAFNPVIESEGTPNDGIVANDGTFSWLIPNSVTTQLRVRITGTDSGFTAIADMSDADAAITGSQMAVTQPTTGSVWPIVSNQTIKWSVDGPIPPGGTVSLYFSTDDGDNWSPVATGQQVDATTGSTGVLWPVPNAAASVEARIKVVDDPVWDPDGVDGVSAQYKITPKITVSFPNGGEKLAAGAPHLVTWQSQGALGNVDIAYSHNGTNFTNLATNENNDGEYEWTPTAGQANGTVWIRVTNTADSDNTDVSDASFKVTNVTVTRPSNASLRYLAGSSQIQLIQWTHTALDNVKIDYSSAGANGPWTQITPTTAATNGAAGVTWAVPNLTSTNYYIRIMDADAVPGANGADTALVTDLSNNPFAVYGTLDVTAPDTNGLEWASGQTQTITWTVSPANVNVVPLVKISVEDLINPGNNQVIVASTNGHNVAAGSGSFPWVPLFTSDSARVKVEDAADALTSNQSTNFFKLTGVAIAQPSGGQSWTVGTQQVIQFSYTGTMGTAKMEYASDGVNYSLFLAGSMETSLNGTNWTPYANNGSALPVSAGPSTPFYVRWVVPDLISSTNAARIKITNNSNSAYATTNGITVTGALTMNTPATLTVGQGTTVSWTKTGTIGTVTVDFSPSGNFSGDEIEVGTGLTGTSTSWTVPNNIGITGKLRVTDTVAGHPATSDPSDAFAIKGNFTFSAPVGSTAWAVDEDRMVDWTNTGTMSNVKLEYATDAGGDNYTTWTEIATNITNNGATGSQPWDDIPDLVILAGNNPNPPSPLNNPTNGVRNVKLRLTDLSHAGAAQAVVESPAFKVKYYLITFNVTNADGNNLADLTASDSVTWDDQSATLTSPTETKRHYKASSQTVTFSKTNFTATTQAFTADADKTVNVVLESEAPTPFEVNLSSGYNAEAAELSLNLSLSKAGNAVTSLASLGVATIEIYELDGTTIATTLTMPAPDANGVYKFPAFDPADEGLTSGNAYLAKCTILYNGTAKTAMKTINFTAEANAQVLIARIGESTDAAGSATLFGQTKAAVTASEAAQTASQAAQSAIGTNNDAAGAPSLFGKQADVMQSLGVLSDAGDGVAEKTVQERLANIEKRSNKPAAALERMLDVSPGSTANLRFKSDTGLSPTADIYDPKNNVVMANVPLTEIGTTGVYEYQWAVDGKAAEGDYTVVMKETVNGTVDSMTVKVEQTIEQSVDLSPVLGSSQTASSFSEKAFKEVDGLKENLNDLMARLADAEALSADGGTANSALYHNVQQGLDATRSQANALASEQGIMDVDKLMTLTEEQKAHIAEQGNHIRVMKEEIVRMNAILDALKESSGSDKPVIKNWMETGSVIIKTLAINPSKEKEQEVPIRTYLPVEAKPEDVINRDEIDIGFDTAKSLFYAEKKVVLKPGETYTMTVHIEDIWMLPNEWFERTADRAAASVKLMEGTASEDLAALLSQNISATLETMRARQSDDSLLPEAHIAAYRMNLELKAQCEKDLETLEALALKAGTPGNGGIGFGKGGGTGGNGIGQAAFVSPYAWNLMLAIIGFLALLSGTSFFVWEKQLKAMVQHKNVNMMAPEAREQMQQKLVSHALRDRLTNLFNAAHFRTLLQQETDTANIMRDRMVSLVMIDVDHFKEVNDTFGHPVGDEVLKGFADVLRTNVRRSDALFRYGGEEFAIILSGLDGEHAAALAEKMRKAAEAKTYFLGDKKTPKKITASFGVATYQFSEPIDVFLGRADKALYRSKGSGRNRVTRDETSPADAKLA